MPSDLSQEFLATAISTLGDRIRRIEDIKEKYTKTRDFWIEPNNVKYRKALCTCHRKLLLTSKDVPVWTWNSVTQPMIFLFDDVIAVWTQVSR